MNKNKVMDGISEIYYKLILKPYTDIPFGTIIAKAIYNNRKEIGLFTLDDIEIDVEKVEDIMCDEVRKNKTFKEMAKAIADKRPIKIKE